MRLRTSLAITAVIVALSTSHARAEEEWYGYQVLATDLGGCALVAGGIMADVPALWVSGLGTILLGGPIVHTSHGDGGRAAASFGLRVGGPLLGGIVGAAIGSASGGGSGAGRYRAGRAINVFLYATAGVLAGYVAAATIDIAYVAREDEGAAAPRMFSIGGHF